jgi:hypothetical protein
MAQYGGYGDAVPTLYQPQWNSVCNEHISENGNKALDLNKTLFQINIVYRRIAKVCHLCEFSYMCAGFFTVVAACNRIKVDKRETRSWVLLLLLSRHTC